MPVDFAEFNRRDRKKVRTEDKSASSLQEQPTMSNGQKAMAGAKLAASLSGGDSSGGSTSTSGGAMKGAAAGAMAGAAFGPYGAAIGGVVGGVTGALSARSNKKKAQAAAEAEKHQALAGIAMEKGQRVNQALNSMAQAFGSTLKQNKFLGRF